MDSPLTNNQFNLIGNNDYKNKKGKNKAIFAFEELNNSNEEIIINNNPENTNGIYNISNFY